MCKKMGATHPDPEILQSPTVVNTPQTNTSSIQAFSACLLHFHPSCFLFPALLKRSSMQNPKPSRRVRNPWHGNAV